MPNSLGFDLALSVFLVVITIVVIVAAFLDWDEFDE